ncbi:hypothetical protein T07_10389 [Trichinella nelsoni]|uniref:Uncharacterized protein n=1 Tax=Trichinella nelsoni TaxID=6336 RepID=A0A0V0SKW2_9BILA|nr:hypothetical protein T07_10389 [Trichinella nelsoni]
MTTLCRICPELKPTVRLHTSPQGKGRERDITESYGKGNHSSAMEEALDLTITLDTFINVDRNQHNFPSLGIPHFSSSLVSEEHRRVHSSQPGKFTGPKCTQPAQTEKSMEYAMPIRGQIYLQWRSLKERKLTEKITSGMKVIRLFLTS